MPDNKHHTHRKPLRTGKLMIACLHMQIAVAHHRATQTNPDPEAIMLQAQIQDQPGKFRLLLENLAQEFLIARDEPVDDDVAHNGALPARSMGSPSRFFERHEEEVASHKGRLPAAKEREANDKSKLVSISQTPAASAWVLTDPATSHTDCIRVCA